MLVTPSLQFARWASSPQSRLLITGASGWVGSAIAHYALAAGLDADRLKLFGSVDGTVRTGGGMMKVLALHRWALRNIEADADWIVIHAAIIGSDRVNGDLLRMRLANDAMLEGVLSLADHINLRRLVFTSSGAALQAKDDGLSPPKRAYATMKADQEARLAAWRDRTNAPVLIARLFNLGGPYINNVNRYALGDFIDAALAERSIRILAKRPTIRTYVHVFDLARALLEASLTGQPFETLETGGAEPMELEALAIRVTHLLGCPDLTIKRPEPVGPPDLYLGDGTRFNALLRASGAEAMGLDGVIFDTARYLSEVRLTR